MRLVFDIEADGLYWNVTEVYCIVAYDVETGAVHKFTPKNILEGVELIFSADTLIGHNILKYDIPVLEKLFSKKYTGKIVDTLIVSRLMYPDVRQHPMGGNGLKHWGIFLGNNKISFDDWSHYSEEMLEYCVQDVLLNFDIAKFQAAAVCFEQELNGFGYDLQAGEELEQAMLIERAELLDNLRTIFPDKVEERWSQKTGKQLKSKVTPFNPQSGKQVYERLVEKYPKIKKLIEFSDAGNPQMDSVVLTELHEKHSVKEAGDIMAYRDNLKLHGQVTDWNERATNSPDGRIHGEVNTQGAGSGRCTHANPNVAQVAGDKRLRALWCPGLKDYVQVGVGLCK
jgi:DNA polymerase I-like protein with 3'-5' exonuclease and polymerase domains